MSSSSEPWSKLMSGEMVLQFAIVCKGLLRLNISISHLKLSSNDVPLDGGEGIGCPGIIFQALCARCVAVVSEDKFLRILKF